MVTRFRVGSNRPTKLLNLHVSTISPLPTSYTDTCNDPHWFYSQHAPRACHGTDNAYLFLYVVDIVLTASSEVLLRQIIGLLHQEFSMTDLGSLNYFLGIFVMRDSSGMFLSHRSLQYLTFTRPNISYVVQQICLCMHDPREPHFSTLKRILRYVHGTLDHGLPLFSSSTTSLVAYSDTDWAEYRGVANNVVETCWLQNLHCKLYTPLPSATLIYCDNVGQVALPLVAPPDLATMSSSTTISYHDVVVDMKKTWSN
ncbi:ribonuclease H-like domain-containing protein [Tanacetum coccineum]